jgi:hypothetical protein
MLQALLRILFVVLLARLLLGVVRGLSGRSRAPQRRPPKAPPAPRGPRRDQVVDVDFEDLPDGERRP